jgi:hypothetical protein
MKNGIEKQAAFYRAYLIDDRSLIPLTIARIVPFASDFSGREP